MSCMSGRLRNSHRRYLISKAPSKEVSPLRKRSSRLILEKLWQWKERVLVTLFLSCFVITEGFYIQARDDVHWTVSHMLNSLKWLPDHTLTYMQVLFSQNVFLIIFELVNCELVNLHVNWSIFGTNDWYLQETSLSQQISQILRESVLFLALGVAKLISCTACLPLYHFSGSLYSYFC